MLAEERKNRILELVNTRKIVKVNELSQLLNTTDVTIRKDLDDLQSQKLLRRIHGGAISFTPVNNNIPITSLTTKCIQEKKAIAELAYHFVDNGDTLLLDRSTTVFELAKLILNSPIKELTIITNSLPLITLLETRPEFQLILIGGEFYHDCNCTYGPLTDRMVANLRSDKCFIGSAGVDISYGFSDPNLNDCSLKNAMLASAKQRFVLADHTKFNESYIGKTADFTGNVDYLLTDTLPPNIDRAEYERNISFIIADEFFSKSLNPRA